MTSLYDLGVEYFSNVTAKDFMNMMLGELVGTGQYRQVYSLEFDDTCVIKLEDKYAKFSNVKEWEVWSAVKGTSYAKWFAPCVKISGNGAWLIQKKTTPARMEELPKEVPAFFTDLKLSNWGRLGKQIVCHDYGNHLLLEQGMTKRMRKPTWK